MNYFQSDDILIQYNPETGVYKRRNNIEHVDTRISKEDFDALPNLKKLKNVKFFEAMNFWFTQVKHSWVYNGESYRKLPNFESNEHNFCNNYDYPKLPNHTPKERKFMGLKLMVYHWGRVYFYHPNYGGSDRGQLEDIKTGNLVRWARMKHVAPIFNEATNKIV